jgi:predicted porin
MQPGGASTSSLRAGGGLETRQQFLTFGDASWGSVKVGKDLGVYASDAILNDMTLLGVGSGAGNLNGTTTLGGIGAGYIYADWKNQIAYTSPNFNGFSFTAAVSQGWDQQDRLDLLPASATSDAGKSSAFEGKIAYAFTGDVAGKVWASAISQKNNSVTNAAAATQTLDAVTGVATPVAAVANTVSAANASSTTTAFDIGANINMAGFGLTGYYGKGKGIGQTLQFNGGLDNLGQKRDSDQYYVQGTYTLPGVGTKLGVLYGESKLDGNTAVGHDTFNDITDSMLTVGVYHPLTKHLNLVAEYSESEQDRDNTVAADAKAKAKTVSLGAILFF